MNPSPLKQEASSTSNPEIKRAKRGLTAAVIAAMGVGALAGCAPAGEKPPTAVESVAPSPEASETPEAEFTVAELPTLEELQVSSEQSDEDIAKGIVNIYSEWNNAGGNKTMFEQSVEGDNGYLGLSEYSVKVAEASAPVFAEALYGDDISDPEIASSIENRISHNAEILHRNYQTYGPQNEASFYLKLDLQSLNNVTENADGTTTYEVTLISDANNDENIVEGNNDDYSFNTSFIVDKSTPVVHLTKAADFTLW